jgi:hypothetical protein
VEHLDHLKSESSIPTRIGFRGGCQVAADSESLHLLKHRIDQRTPSTGRLNLPTNAENTEIDVWLMGMSCALDLLAAQDLGNDGQDERKYGKNVENEPNPPGKALWVCLRGQPCANPDQRVVVNCAEEGPEADRVDAIRGQVARKNPGSSCFIREKVDDLLIVPERIGQHRTHHFQLSVAKLPNLHPMQL